MYHILDARSELAKSVLPLRDMLRVLRNEIFFWSLSMRRVYVDGNILRSVSKWKPRMVILFSLVANLYFLSEDTDARVFLAKAFKKTRKDLSKFAFELETVS